MTTPAVESHPWPRCRWWGVVALLAVGQFALVFWLGERAPNVPRKTGTSPLVSLATRFSGELLALYNPTLFVWSNCRGFSGGAWQRIPAVDYRLPDLTEPPQWLSLQADELGAILRDFMQTNPAPPFSVVEKIKPHFTLPELVATDTALAARSTFRVGGDLDGRHLLSQFDLPSWPHADLLTNSVVQIIVGADGRTISAALLSSSGSTEADKRALDLARATRFDSLRESGPSQLTKGVEPLSWGQLIFEWHTTPLPSAPPAPP